MRWWYLIVILFLLLPQTSYSTERDEQLYRKGIAQYKIGSYSTALDYFLKLLKPKSKYYAKSLLMLSKTYYAIGRKTGKKRFFWQALNYLQLYFIERGNRKLPWDYYYMKAKIYEALSFYEQALAVYRVAFLFAENQQERIDTTIGIVRTALWCRRKDIVDEYFILISTAKLNQREKREVLFVEGLILFLKGKYSEALKFFLKLYREFEDYLIDNPEYYFYVAEDIYRTGNTVLAERLFQRIVSLTKDPETVRKSILRLGDIALSKGNYTLAFVYYYSVIRDYPNSDEAQVARLKIIPMMENPKVKYRALLSKDEAFKDPISYITKVLVNYRTTYVGIYALSDFGYLVFKLKTPENVFKRLTWEVSLVFPQQIKYEQKEFLRYLWEPYLVNLSSKKMCSLYRANPPLFQNIFGKKILLKIVKDLKKCNQRKLRISLLQFIISKWKKDKDKILLAEALIDDKDFKTALNVLRKVKNKNLCSYKLTISKIRLIVGEKLREVDLPIGKCKNINPVEVSSIGIAYFIQRGKLQESFKIFKAMKTALLKEYKDNLTVRLAVNRLLEYSVSNSNYVVAMNVAKSLVEKGYQNCFVGSVYTLSAVRTNDKKDAQLGNSIIKGCVDYLSNLARTAFEDMILEEEVGALQRATAN